MKEFILTETSSERAVLVGLITPKVTERQVQDYLDELAFLSTTAGISPVKSFVQRLDMPNSATFVGKGKLEEIASYHKGTNGTCQNAGGTRSIPLYAPSSYASLDAP